MLFWGYLRCSGSVCNLYYSVRIVLVLALDSVRNIDNYKCVSALPVCDKRYVSSICHGLFSLLDGPCDDF